MVCWCIDTFHMELFTYIYDFIFQIDTHLGDIIAQYGTLSYAILFLVLFVETGFVFVPFLPGDSLLFAAGAFSAMGSFNVCILLVSLWFAAFLGDTVNYWIGHFFGQKLIANEKIHIKQAYIDKTQMYFDKYGGKTIFLARFIPIVRTFAPFIAGIGKMNYAKFLLYNVSGGFVWVFGFVLSGFFFGNISLVKDNFSIVILGIITLSIVPVIVEYIRAAKQK